MVPRQRQQRDVDAKADYGQVAVHQPGQHLERLEGPRPAVHPRRLGKNQFGLAAAVHGRRPPQSLTAAAHLEGSRSHFSGDAATFVEEMTYGNELGVNDGNRCAIMDLLPSSSFPHILTDIQNNLACVFM